MTGGAPQHRADTEAASGNRGLLRFPYTEQPLYTNVDA